MTPFIIDKERCIRCGICAQDCPTGVIEMHDFPVLNKTGCNGCQHCLAVCPTGALSVLDKKPADSTPLQGNLPAPEKMQTLIKGRRSVRHYKDENIDQETLQKLLETVWHAPTGMNAQAVQLTVIRDKDQMDTFRAETYRLLSQILPEDPATDDKATQNLRSCVDCWNAGGTDMIFRGAPHLIVASAAKTAPCAGADTLIALAYFELMAQTLGIGTVWDGRFMTALARQPKLKALLDVSDDYQIGYAMAFGKPGVNYHRTVQRGSANIKTLSL